jgi:hypothetical protein
VCVHVRASSTLSPSYGHTRAYTQEEERGANMALGAVEVEEEEEYGEEEYEDELNK